MISVSIRASTRYSKNYIFMNNICRFTTPCKQHKIPLHPNTMKSFSKSHEMKFASYSTLPAILHDPFSFITKILKLAESVPDSLRVFTLKEQMLNTLILLKIKETGRITSNMPLLKSILSYQSIRKSQ